MKIVFTILIIFSFLIPIWAQQQLPWRLNEKQVKIQTGTPADCNGVIQQLNAINASGKKISFEEGNGFIRAYITPEEQDELTNAGISFITEVADLNALSASFGARGVPTGYYTMHELNEIADSLATNFPSICTKQLIGTSSASDPIYALKISDNSSADEAEPELLFDGGIHGDEIGGPENLIRFARDLCIGYGVTPLITECVNNAETWIIYAINPYGRNNMTRYNANGIDINRDCGYMWNGEGNSTGAFSQPETRIIRNMLLEHQFVMHLSYHSGTEFISYPWSYRESLCPDNANHDYLAQQYASNSGYSNIPLGPGFTGMYAINGSTKDFGYGSTGAISWSVEISVSKQPPANQIVPYYLKNKDAMIAMITNSINQGIHGIVSDAVTGEPISGTVFIDNLYPVSTSSVNGDYHKFLTPGTYNVSFKTNDYLPSVQSGVTILTGQQTEVNAELTKGGGYYATRVISCRIPNNNPADEGNTPAAISSPDSVSYSIGRNGFVILDMGSSVLNSEGADFKVFENDATAEGYSVYAGNTPDGAWILLGSGTSTASFDMGGTFLSKARYIKITDDGDGQSVTPNAGFDLDAVENLHPDTLTVGWISGTVYNNQLPYFTIPGAVVEVNGNETIADENGLFSIAALPGEIIIAGSTPNYHDSDTLTVTLGDTIQHDLHLALIENVEYGTHFDGFNIYPTPANEKFTITGITGNYLLRIYNQSGTEIQHKVISLDNNGYTYQVSNLSPGLYLIRLSDGKVDTSLKVLVRD